MGGRATFASNIAKQTECRWGSPACADSLGSDRCEPSSGLRHAARTSRLSRMRGSSAGILYAVDVFGSRCSCASCGFLSLHDDATARTARTRPTRHVCCLCRRLHRAPAAPAAYGRRHGLVLHPCRPRCRHAAHFSCCSPRAVPGGPLERQIDQRRQRAMRRRAAGRRRRRRQRRLRWRQRNLIARSSTA